jgi:histidinol-phosphatase
VDEPDLRIELAFANRLADAAAEVTLAWFGDRLARERKADGSIVTELDRRAEHAVRELVRAERPGDGVLGEEEGLAEGDTGRVWVVDPIDGTMLFAEGIPLWTTLIGLRVADRFVLGVADAPALGDRYHALAGGGAWRGRRRLRVSEVDRLADALLLHSGLEGWLGARDGALARLARAARLTTGLSNAWGHLLVAQGSAELLLEAEPCFEWDWGPTSVILEEAGGRLTTLEGNRPSPGCDLLVSNGRVHDEALRLLAG